MNGSLDPSWARRIADREQLLGQESVRRMAQVFVNEISVLLGTFQSAVDREDLELARRISHQIAGNSGALDLIELCTLAQSLEKQCSDKSTTVSVENVGALVEHARNAEALLKRHFSLS